MLVDVLKSDFNASASIPFGPDDFPFFNVLIALLTSVFWGVLALSFVAFLLLVEYLQRLVELACSVILQNILPIFPFALLLL